MTNSSTMAAPSGAVDDSIDWVAINDGDLPEKPRLYINVYMIDQAYGGPEEGDWWYTCGRPVESRLADNEAEAEDILAERRAYWDGHNEGRPEIYSVISEGRFSVRRESRYARQFPKTIPHYE